jgi:hypothetical protein
MASGASMTANNKMLSVSVRVFIAFSFPILVIINSVFSLSGVFQKDSEATGIKVTGWKKNSTPNSGPGGNRTSIDTGKEIRSIMVLRGKTN